MKIRVNAATDEVTLSFNAGDDSAALNNFDTLLQMLETAENEAAKLSEKNSNNDPISIITSMTIPSFTIEAEIFMDPDPVQANWE